MKNFHTIQLSILQKLLYSNGLKYSQLKSKKMEGSQFTFHLDQLIKHDYVNKFDTDYSLTSSGKELANRMDLGDKTIGIQAKISVLIVCIEKSKTNSDRYLLYTRLKSPFYNYQGFPTGKVLRGENILDGAKRELYEETGLVGSPELFAIRHYKIYDLNKNLLEDKVFFACKFINPTGELTNNPEGNYKWVNKESIWDYLKRPVNEIKEIIKALNSDNITFLEKEYTTDGF